MSCQALAPWATCQNMAFSDIRVDLSVVGDATRTLCSDSRVGSGSPRTVSVRRPFCAAPEAPRRPVHEADHWLRWSHWRRRHQGRSRASHCSWQAASRA